MQVLRKILKVEKGKVSVDIPDDFGNEIEVIIRPMRYKDSSWPMVKLQEESDFVRKVLADEKEDVWNEI